MNAYTRLFRFIPLTAIVLLLFTAACQAVSAPPTPAEEPTQTPVETASTTAEPCVPPVDSRGSWEIFTDKGLLLGNGIEEVAITLSDDHKSLVFRYTGKEPETHALLPNDAEILIRIAPDIPGGLQTWQCGEQVYWRIINDSVVAPDGVCPPADEANPWKAYPKEGLSYEIQGGTLHLEVVKIVGKLAMRLNHTFPDGTTWVTPDLDLTRMEPPYPWTIPDTVTIEFVFCGESIYYREIWLNRGTQG